MNTPAPTDPSEAVIVYDGECPFCSRYVLLVRLREAVGKARLVNARDHGAEAEYLWRLGYNLDEGMALMYQGQIFFGGECLHRLALLSTRSNIFNQVNASIFSSSALSAVLYPILRFGRSITLRILGRSHYRFSDAAGRTAEK